jgi:LacI family transcriptional regulator
MTPPRGKSVAPHVALLVETSMAYGREILHGVARYIRENGPWTVYIEQRSLQDPTPPWLENWDGDGIIWSETGGSVLKARLGRKLGIPIVDLDDQKSRPGRPQVGSNHEAIGALAAEHLLDRGFTHFAFFGYPGFVWSNQCFHGFGATIRAAGFRCQKYHRASRVSWGHQLPSWEAEMNRVSRWIAALPKPLGLMACNDFRGVQALDACRRAGVAVPEEVAVIGADNEVLACELAYPPLSSVVPDCRAIGFEAASLLDRMMKGEPSPQDSLKIPPLGIVTRRSTDIVAIEDPCVAEAMRFIREHSGEGIGVEDVLQHVSVSRSWLQRRFRATLGRSIHEVIASERVRRVKQLLIATELSLESIARRCGFTYPAYMSTVFHEATGHSPARYRRLHAHRP